MIRYHFILLLSLVMCSCGSEDIWKQQQLDLRLLEATADGLEGIVDSCLQYGANIEVRNMEGATPLISAAVRGHYKVVEKLLDKGASPNARRLGYYGSTALMEAAVRNDTSIARILLEHGANIHQRDTFGDPAINWAAYYGQVSYIALLLEYGAAWDIESHHGTALDIAAKEWQLEACDFFIRKGAGEKLEGAALTLIKAVKSGDSLAVTQLLEDNDPNFKDPLGMPLLSWASAKGHQSVVRSLLSSGADVNAQDRTGQTALSAAARFGNDAIVEELITAGANVNLAGSEYQLSPLINAAIKGNASIGSLLIEKGAAIDHQDKLVGYSALMYAVANGHREFVELLIRHEANPYIKGHDDTGLYELIGLSGDEYIAKTLEAYILKKQ